MMLKVSATMFAIAALLAGSKVLANGMPIDNGGMPALPPSSIQFVEGSYIVTFKDRQLAEGSMAAERPLILPPDRARNLRAPVPFGTHSTGQSKSELAATLGIRGEVVKIFEAVNAAHIRMDAEEAYRLSLDRRVLRVEQEAITTTASTTQYSPGWGLDRLDSGSASLNSSYTYTNNGAGQTIYVLDTGLNVGSSSVTAEFGNRATMFYDFNGGTGNDCQGHGSGVASAAASSTYGVAKGAALKIVKITTGCTGSSDSANSINSFNWLAANAPSGTIVNWSQSFPAPSTLNQYGDPVFTCGSYFDTGLETAIKAAYNAGIIVVVAAGNDGCNTADYSPTNIPEAFVVGATQNSLLNGYDSLAEFRGNNGTGNGGTRVGSNISTFAPGRGVPLMWYLDGYYVPNASGTSFAAPYVAGLFAVACQAVGSNYCATASSYDKYNGMRNTGTLNTVVNSNGSPLTSSTSRFIWQQW